MPRGQIVGDAPPRTLGTSGVKVGLARVCAVLSGWEESYRALTLPAELLALHQLS